MRSTQQRLHATALATSILLVFLALPVGVFGQPEGPKPFEEFLKQRFGLNRPEWTLESFCPVSSSLVALRVFESYGSMFAANESVQLPDSCVLSGEAAVIKYQKKLQKRSVDVGGIVFELQAPAADSLTTALTEVEARGLRVSAFDGPIAGGRSYGDTLRLWNSRFFPAMEFWIRRGRLSEADREEVSRMDLKDKIEKVLEWETQGIFFSTDRSRSILTSTAPPGTSQHLALIALDVAEYWDTEVRAIMNRNGWFQTVLGDPPHFTYLGVPENQLPGRGLRAVWSGGFQFWIPNISRPGTPTG